MANSVQSRVDITEFSPSSTALCPCGGVSASCPCRNLKQQRTVVPSNVSPNVKAAAVKIQRFYRTYRLRKMISQLQTTEPWLFMWAKSTESTDAMDVDSDEEDDAGDTDDDDDTSGPGTSFAADDQALPDELRFARLQAKFQDKKFFAQMSQLLELLGSAKSASSCHAKMLLMAFMLNHHRTLLNRTSAVNITALGPALGLSPASTVTSLPQLATHVSSEPMCSAPNLSSTLAGTSPSLKDLSPSQGLQTPPNESNLLHSVASSSSEQTYVEPLALPPPETPCVRIDPRSMAEELQRAKICAPQCSQPLMRQISNLGVKFLEVCAAPHCCYRRMDFMVAYSRYSKTFLDWKAKDAMQLIKTQVDMFSESFDTLSQMNQMIRSGKLSEDRCRISVGRLRCLTESYFMHISRLLGSSKRAKEIVHKDLVRKRFTAELKKRLQTNQLIYVEWTAKSTSKNQARMACMQSLIERVVTLPRVRSREAKFDTRSMQMWYGKYNRRLENIKLVLKSNYDVPEGQAAWLPQLIAYLKWILTDAVIHDEAALEAFLRPLDMEFLAQQCVFNNCKPKEYLEYFLTTLRAHASPLRQGVIAQQLQELRATEEVKLEQILLIVDTFDDARVDVTEAGLRNLTAPILRQDVRKNEMSGLAHDLISNRTGIANLERWVDMAAMDKMGFVKAVMEQSSNDKCSALPLSRLESLMVYYSWMIAKLPDTVELDALPETFTMLRLPILHLQLLIRDVVVGFTVVQLTSSVSRDESYLCRLKTRVMSVLREEGVLTGREIAAKVCAAIDVERPALSSRERSILHGLVSKLLDPHTRKEREQAMSSVPKLTLDRIRVAIQGRLVHPGESVSGGEVKLAFFECELKQIVHFASNIWKLSLGTYKPVYETVVNSKILWQSGQARGRSGPA